jgi:glycosyltransferase involved in cell wall biosynthesis
MTDLVVNGAALSRSSRGVKRYFSNIYKHLNLPGEITITKPSVSPSLDRLIECFTFGDQRKVFWTPCQTGPVLVRNHVVTFHDCISLKYIYTSGVKKSLLLTLTQQVVRNAKVVVAISRSTKDSMVECLGVDPDTVSVIQSSCDVDLKLSGGERFRGRSECFQQTPFILMVTNSLPHKNTLRACSAFVKSGFGHGRAVLRIVGSVSPEAFSVLKTSGCKFEILDNVDDRDLARLYSECSFLLAPSLEEGHNLAIAEALSFGCNVLCSDIPVHREFYGDHVEYFDAYDENILVDKLVVGLARQGRWFPPFKNRRSFANVADDYKAIFYNLLSE